MNAGASTSAVPSPIEGSGTAWVLLGSWALSPARPTPIHPRPERRGFSALLVKVLSLWCRQRGGIQRRPWKQPARTACDGSARHSVRCREERVWEGSRYQRRRIRWEQGQRQGAIQRELLQIDQQVSLRGAVAHALPERRFHQMRRKRRFKTARHLADRSDFSP